MQPSSIPSGQPTSRPSSSKPTGMPTGYPTKYPTTSSPTLEGDTNPPSSLPTVNPTINSMDYITNPLYSEYVQTMMIERNRNRSAHYGMFYYKGNVISGSEVEWNVFTSSAIVLPATELYHVRVRAEFAYYLFGQKKLQSITPVCENRRVVSNLVDALQLSVGSYSEYCDGYTWNIFSCNGIRIFCVNCKQSCVDSVRCPGTSSYIINPDRVCSAYSAAYGIVAFEYAVDKRYPLLRHPLGVVPLRDSIQLSINITRDGNIYCAAIAQRNSLTIRSIFDIKPYAKSVVAWEDGLVKLTIDNLGPSTTYDVMCYTSSFDGQIMTIEESLTSKINVTTSCCRALVLNTYYGSIVQYIPGNAREENVYRIGLDSAPSSSVIVKINATRIDCNTRNVISRVGGVLYPSTFSFSSNSSSLLGSFVIRSSSPGCFQVFASAIGDSQYNPLNFSVIVRNIRVAPPAPVLLSAIIGTDGYRFTISFDSSTDKGKYKIGSISESFNCSKVFAFIGSYSAICSWLTSSRVQVVPADTSMILGESIVLLDRSIKAACVDGSDCSQYDFAKQQSLTLTKDNDDLKPVVLLYGAAAISFCDDMKIDPTSSYGHGSKPWITVSWLVFDETSGRIFYNISSFLNNKFNSTNDVAIIPQDLLSSGTKYTIRLTLTNFLLQSALSSITVNVGNGNKGAVPQARIYGIQQVFYSFQPINLIASVDIPSCMSVKNSTTIKYEWKMYKNYVYDKSLVSSSLDPKVFFLPEFSLQPAMSYNLVLEVSTGLVYSRTSSTLIIGKGNIVSKVSLGTSATLGKNALLLDGSSSYDEDHPDAILLYSWYCYQISPIFGNTCINFPSYFNSSILILESGVLNYGTYNITVVVSADDGRSSSSSTTVTVTSKIAPLLRAQAVSWKYNTDEKLVLSVAIFANASSVTASWNSPTIENFQNSGLSSTPLTRQIAFSGFSSKVAVFQLALKANTLTAGKSYSFTLQASYDGISDSSSFLTLSVLMNSPPMGGKVVIEPPSGTTLATNFLFTSSLWSDDHADYPLAYSFGYYIVNSLNLVMVQSSSAVSYVSSLIAQGLPSLNYNVVGVVVVSDIYRSGANSTTTVKVTPLSSIGEALSIATSTLAIALQAQNPMIVMQTVSASLEVINMVDCSKSPACSNLNRQECQRTAGTCGECLPGYIGVR